MAPAPQRHVLRLDLEGAGGQQHVLVAITPTDDADHTLDLDLIATDDSKAWVMTRMFHSCSSIRLSMALCLCLFIWPRAPSSRKPAGPVDTCDSRLSATPQIAPAVS